MSVILKSDGPEQVLKLIFLLLFDENIGGQHSLKRPPQSNHILRWNMIIFINYVTEFANYITIFHTAACQNISLCLLLFWS